MSVDKRKYLIHPKRHLCEIIFTTHEKFKKKLFFKNNRYFFFISQYLVFTVFRPYWMYFLLLIIPGSTRVKQCCPVHVLLRVRWPSIWKHILAQHVFSVLLLLHMGSYSIEWSFSSKWVFKVSTNSQQSVDCRSTLRSLVFTPFSSILF